MPLPEKGCLKSSNFNLLGGFVCNKQVCVPLQSSVFDLCECNAGEVAELHKKRYGNLVNMKIGMP